MKHSGRLLSATISLLIMLLLVNTVLAEGKHQNTEQTDLALKAKENLAYTIGLHAYIYGFATVELYRSFFEQVIDPNRGHSVGVNEFNHIRKLATPQDT